MKSPLLQIEVLKGSLLNIDAQVIVNMANSHGVMGGGVAGAMRRAAGVEVENKAIRLASILVGSAILISGGKLVLEESFMLQLCRSLLCASQSAMFPKLLERL